MSLSNIKDGLINENTYLNVMSNDRDEKLKQAEIRLDEALKANRQLTEILNKLINS